MKNPDKVLDLDLATQYAENIEIKVTDAEDLFQSTFAKAPIGIAHLALDGRWMAVNERLCEILGYSKEELCKKTSQDLTPVGSIEDEEQARDQLLRGLVKNYQVERRYIHKSGHVLWASVSCSLACDSSGRPAHYISIIDDITMRKKNEQVLLDVAKGVSASTGRMFLSSLVEFLTRSLGADCAFVGRLSETEVRYLRTVAVHVNGAIGPNFDYDLSGSPWGEVAFKGLSSYSRGVQEKYPEDLLLRDVQAEGYVAAPLIGSNGALLGLVAVIFRQPIVNLSIAVSLLQIFAARAGSEIQREMAENQRAAALLQMETALSDKQQLLDSSLDAICEFDINGRFIQVSAAAGAVWGYTPDELIGSNYLDHVLPDDIKKTKNAAKAIIAGQPTRDFEHRCIRKDGSIAHIMWSAQWSETEKSMSGVARDVTDSRTATKALKDSEESLRFVFEASNFGSWEYDLKTNESRRSLRHDQLFGFKTLQAEWDFDKALSLIHPDDQETVRNSYNRLIADHTEHNVEYRVIWPDGTIHWLWTIGRIRLDVQNQSMRVSGVLADITARKESEIRLRFSETNMSVAQRIANFGSWELDLSDTTDINNGALHWSDEVFRIFGYEPGEIEVSRENFLLSVHPEDRQQIRNSIEHSILTRADYTLEHRVILPNGDIRHVYENARVFVDEKTGALQKMVGIVHDITDRLRAQEALTKSEERYRRIVELAQEGIWMIDAEGKTTFVNIRMTEILGYHESEMLGRAFTDFMDPSAHSEADLYFARRREGIEEQIDFRFQHKNGADVWTITSTCPIMSDEGNFVGALALITDITERKKAEVTLQQSEAALANAQRLAHLGNWDWDLVTGELRWSDEVYRIFGFNREESDIDYGIFLESIHPDDREMVNQSVQTALAGGTPYNIDHRIVHKDGTVRVVHDQGEVILGESGRASKMSGTVLDITERQMAEEKIRESLHEKNVLLKEIHHRVKNNLQVISSLLALRVDSISDPKTRQILVESQQRIRSMSMIHEHFYQSNNLAKVDFGDYLQSLVDFLHRSYIITAGRVTLSVEVDQDVRVNMETAVPLGLMVNELVSNAFKHSFKSGEGVLSVSLRREDAESYSLTIADDGPGLPEGFDLSKTESLGMRLVETFTRQLKGKLTINRENGLGFRLDFKELFYAERN